MPRGNYEFISINGDLWLKIFQQNAPALFSSDKIIAANQVFDINEANRYSIIGYIDDNFKINGVFIFLYRFPIEYPDDYFYFNQSTHPLISYTVKDFRYNFTTKKCNIDYNHQNMLNGIAISKSPETLLDGIYGDNTAWWYAIGVNSLHRTGFPGPYCDNKESTSSQTSQLWIRIKNKNIMRNLPNYAICHSMQNLYSFFIFNHYLLSTSYYVLIS